MCCDERLDARNVELLDGGNLAELLQATSFQLAGTFLGHATAMSDLFQGLRFVARSKPEAKQQDFSFARVETIENPHQDVVLRLILTLGLELIAAIVGGPLEDFVRSGLEAIEPRVLGRDRWGSRTS